MTKSNETSRALLIEAHSVHTGGALSLLKIFLKDFDLDERFSTSIVLDTRCPLVLNSEKFTAIRRVNPDIFSRTINAIKICFFQGSIFCFGNLPPLFSRSKEVIVFLHNSLYFEPELIRKFPLKTRLRLSAERFFFRIRYRSVTKFLVQTPHMKDRLCMMSFDCKKIVVAPFADISQYQKINTSGSSFICVSSGDAHKNIRNLILAWVKLHQDGISPKLFLTLSNTTYRDLVGWVDAQVNGYGLNIENLGVIQSTQINKIYQSGSALIFPSCTESFGLPLIEAREAGVDILASEMDFVRDIVNPVQSFDPFSPISIARAVKRYLSISEAQLKMKSISELTRNLFEVRH
jgi:glycosyltransferase involved in cell wall biosynthesis